MSLKLLGSLGRYKLELSEHFTEPIPLSCGALSFYLFAALAVRIAPQGTLSEQQCNL